MNGRDPREQNRRSWNAVVGAHDSHRGNLADFLRSGGSTLFPEELGLLGDVYGRTLAHLMCNSGGDSLSLARLGARVTGVDISDQAVSSARELSRKAGLREPGGLPPLPVGPGEGRHGAGRCRAGYRNPRRVPVFKRGA